MVDRESKTAQEEYVQEFAAEKGITVAQLGNRLLNDLAAGVPEETMNILARMYATCERVTAGMTVCESCGLSEDGLRIRNISPRPNGKLLCADCAQLQKEEQA